MKSLFSLSVASVALVGFMASQADARGGRGGGGHAGGARGGAHQAVEHRGNNAERRERPEQHQADHQGDVRQLNANRDRHFTPGWNANHPNAWQSAHPYFNPWAAATFGAAAAWLGMSAVDGGYPVYDSTVYTSDSDSTSDDAADDSDATDDDASSQQAATANQLAQSGTTEPGQDANFLPLGVFSLARQGQDEVTGFVQLAVSKQGVLRGTYHDATTDQVLGIQGAVNKDTGRAAWTIAPNGKTVFETSLRSLTQDSGNVLVHSVDGHTRQWTIQREQEQSQADVDGNITE